LDRDVALNRPPPRREVEQREMGQALETALSRINTMSSEIEEQNRAMQDKDREIALLRQQVAVNHGGDFAHRRFYHPIQNL